MRIALRCAPGLIPQGTRAVQGYMTKAGHGRIVNVSSTSALGNRGQVNYAAAKGGLESFTADEGVGLRTLARVPRAIPNGFQAENHRLQREVDQLKDRGRTAAKDPS